MKVKRVTHAGKADVYNMTVDDTHNFVIQGGVIAHNCDDVRYMCMMRPIAPREVQTTYVPISDPLDQLRAAQGRYSSYNNIRR